MNKQKQSYNDVVAERDALKAERDALKAELAKWDECHRAVSETHGVNPETWPSHGNKQLAVAALVALRVKDWREALARTELAEAALAEQVQVSARIANEAAMARLAAEEALASEVKKREEAEAALTSTRHLLDDAEVYRKRSREVEAQLESALREKEAVMIGYLHDEANEIEADDRFRKDGRCPDCGQDEGPIGGTL